MNVERFSLFREDGSEWCKAQIELREKYGTLELSICGDAGYILTEEEAQQEAKEFWVTFFEDTPNAIPEECEGDEEKAAEQVLAVDGDFHGLDVEDIVDDKVYITTSCGQIREELSEWFPEIMPLFKWHLNCMKAGCVHQYLKKIKDLGNKCPACGTVYGKGWNNWPLPKRVLNKIQELRDLSNLESGAFH